VARWRCYESMTELRATQNAEGQRNPIWQAATNLSCVKSAGHGAVDLGKPVRARRSWSYVRDGLFRLASLLRIYGRVSETTEEALVLDLRALGHMPERPS
jgi:hypothetical protein